MTDPLSSPPPSARRALLREIGVSLSIYLGPPPFLGSVLWIVLRRVFKGSPALSEPTTWIFSGAALFVMLVGFALHWLSDVRFGRREPR